VHVNVDQARRDDEPLGVESLGCIRRTQAPRRGFNAPHAPALDQDVGRLVEAARRVNDAPALDE
jgi:hypothetical protein